VAAVQFESAPADKNANFRKIEAFVERAECRMPTAERIPKPETSLESAIGQL
jgi:predicted amidohydrolase